MQGSAAQSSEAISGRKTAPKKIAVDADTSARFLVSSADSQNSLKIPPRRLRGDSSRAKAPTRTTGQSSGQSSVIKDLPDTKEQDKVLPWEQQSAGKSNKGSEKPDNKAGTESQSAWQQQSSTEKQNKTKANENPDSKQAWEQQAATQKPKKTTATRTNRSSDRATPNPRIRRVIIDPQTGLYLDTNVNNPAGENANMSFDNRQEDLLEWPFWEMDGRIGLTVAKDSYNGSVAWEQDGAEIDFRFRGPLGFGGIRIHGSLDEKVRVKTTTGLDFTVTDFEQEMQAKMGWSIPINSLRYWALGIVDPEVDADVVINEQDLLDELQQGDWKVVYERYKNVDDVQLPSKFKISGPDTKIKMLVNDWSIPSAE